MGVEVLPMHLYPIRMALLSQGFEKDRAVSDGTVWRRGTCRVTINEATKMVLITRGKDRQEMPVHMVPGFLSMMDL